MNEPRTRAGRFLSGAAGKEMDLEACAIENEAMELGAKLERERLRAIASDPEQNDLAHCPDELHQHAHEWCNGRGWHELLAEPKP